MRKEEHDADKIVSCKYCGNTPLKAALMSAINGLKAENEKLKEKIKTLESAAAGR